MASDAPLVLPRQRPLVVSITGPSGAGKSQLVKAVVDRLSPEHAARVPTDYFLADLLPGAGVDAGRLVYDWDLLADRLALPIGTATSTPDFDFARMQRREVCGGLRFIIRHTMLTDAMEPFPAAHLKILLTVPAATRHQRIIARDRVWGTRVHDRWPALEAAWQRVIDRQFAWDLVLDGTNAIEENAASVSEVVLRSLRSDAGTRHDRDADRRNDSKERG